MNSCFEKRQLWEAILENNFGKQLSETTFGGNFGNLGMSPIATPATKRKFMWASATPATQSAATQSAT